MCWKRSKQINVPTLQTWQNIHIISELKTRWHLNPALSLMPRVSHTPSLIQHKYCSVHIPTGQFEACDICSFFIQTFWPKLNETSFQSTSHRHGGSWELLNLSTPSQRSEVRWEGITGNEPVCVCTAELRRCGPISVWLLHLKLRVKTWCFMISCAADSSFYHLFTSPVLCQPGTVYIYLLLTAGYGGPAGQNN